MFATPDPGALQRLLDKEAIREAMCRYARGVDRGDWQLVRSAYHDDAYDEHGDYAGSIEGLIAYLDHRFESVDNSVHFLGNSLIDFHGPDTALVETYFVSRRLRPGVESTHTNIRPVDALARELWGRYIDRFDRRDGAWRIAYRTVVRDAFSESVALDAYLAASMHKGVRGAADKLYEQAVQIFKEF